MPSSPDKTVADIIPLSRMILDFTLPCDKEEIESYSVRGLAVTADITDRPLKTKRKQRKV